MNLTIAAQPIIGGPALGALVVALIWGVLLLLFGAKLLRPMIVLAALLTGVLIGVVVARTWVPQTPLWVAAAVGGVLGVVAGALLYRPAVATASACVGAVVGALVAWTVIAGGALDSQPRDTGHGLVAHSRETAITGDGARSSAQLLDIVTTQPVDARETSGQSPVAASAATVGDRILRDVSELFSRGATRVRAAFSSTAQAYRTLLFGCIATGAVIGFIAGLLATTTVARILTSCAGAGLTMLGAVPLLALAGYAPLPPGPRAWLICMGAFALVGVVLQTMLSKPAAAPKAKAPKRARDPEPAAA